LGRGGKGEMRIGRGVRKGMGEKEGRERACPTNEKVVPAPMQPASLFLLLNSNC